MNNKLGKVYFIGIKGVGMTSLAIAMQEAGWVVSGCDTDEIFITDEVLKAHNVVVGPLDSLVPLDSTLIVCSAAYTQPKTTIRTLSLAEALAEFIKDRKVIAIAGVGGKTTTSAMLAALFHAAGRDVGYYVGTSTIAGLSSPGHCGTDPYFVVEADEYAISKSDPRPKFSLLAPDILITTNIVHDHPDIYVDENATLGVFRELALNVKRGGTWIASDTDRLTKKIWTTLGESYSDLGVNIDFYSTEDPLYAKLSLNVFGEQNKLDALAAVKAAVATGLSQNLALESIKSYKGAGRRQEFHGEVEKRLLYDDYGHHPGEIEVTMRSFKEKFPDKRVILVFESHTYTRTESLLSEFSKSIASADLPFIMPIFESAREKGQPHTITPESFAKEVDKYNPLATSLTWDNAAKTIAEASQPGDIILTMGAGFVYKLHDQIIKELTHDKV